MADVLNMNYSGRTALITGASSGIGRSMAVLLDKMGFSLILCARSEDKLNELSASLSKPAEVIALDLSVAENCYRLYEQTRDKNVWLLVNNAGFGSFGLFTEVPLETELNMLDLNVRAVHILTKLFLKDFVKRNDGKILNVSSGASFVPGPLLAAYYSTKAYVTKLTQSIAGELRHTGSKVTISALCPGPVRTNFDSRAGVTFSAKGLDSDYVARYAIKGTLKEKVLIIPGAALKLGVFSRRLVSDRILTDFIYNFQRKKGN